jgi:acetyl esterase/lipase
MALQSCQQGLSIFAQPTPTPSPLAGVLRETAGADGLGGVGPAIVTYKEIGSRGLQAHIFLPGGWSSDQQHAALAFFHGGGWYQGTPVWGYNICRYFADRDMVTISFQYRLSDNRAVTPIAAIEDAKSAIRWTRQNADILGINPDQIAAAGFSAGGHLAATTAMVEDFQPAGEDETVSSAPNALLLWSAPVDVTVDPWYLRLLLGRTRAEASSPAHHVRSDLPPTAIFHGTADNTVPYRTVEDFRQAMVAAENEVELHAYRGQQHLFEDAPNRQDVLMKMETFLTSLGYIEPAKD